MIVKLIFEARIIEENELIRNILPADKVIGALN